MWEQFQTQNSDLGATPDVVAATSKLRFESCDTWHTTVGRRVYQIRSVGQGASCIVAGKSQTLDPSTQGCSHGFEGSQTARFDVPLHRQFTKYFSIPHGVLFVIADIICVRNLRFDSACSISREPTTYCTSVQNTCSPAAFLITLQFTMVAADIFAKNFFLSFEESRSSATRPKTL